MTVEVQNKPRSARKGIGRAKREGVTPVQDPAYGNEWAGLTNKEKHELADKMLRQLRIDVERHVEDSRDLLKGLS